MEVEHNAAYVEATKAPTCELMRGPMLLSKAPASPPLLHFYQGREHTPGYCSHMSRACVRTFSKGGFPRQCKGLQEPPPFTQQPTRTRTLTQSTHTTVRSGGFDGTKDHNKTKAQMTPSCDNPSCSYLPLSDNISDALKKSTYLIEQPLPILFVLKES